MGSQTNADFNEVALITRCRTPNKGNQALSVAWSEMLSEAFPGATVRALERVPRHLLQYTVAQLTKSADPFEEFSKIVTHLASLAPGPGAADPAGPPTIELDETMGPPKRLVGLRKYVRPRAVLSALGLERANYRRRLAALQRARIVVMNPAGEFHGDATDIVVQYLLDIMVAKRLGRPVGIVNLSLEVENETLRRLIPKVYEHVDVVEFRDEESVDRLRGMGGDASRCFVVPDLALMTPTPPVTRRPGTVAIAINAVRAEALRLVDGWRELLRGLKRAKHHVVLVSNEVPTDLPLYRRLAAEFDAPIEGEGLDHTAYAALLGSYDLVVTSRLHTAILALVAGGAVLPVESGRFKINGLFRELGFKRHPIDTHEPAWAMRTMEQATDALQHRDDVVREGVEAVTRARARIREGVIPRLRGAAL